MYAAFLIIPLLILMGVLGFGGTGDYYRGDNVPRWNAMAISIVNLLWLTGVFWIFESAYHKVLHRKIEETRTRG